VIRAGRLQRFDWPAVDCLDLFAVQLAERRDTVEHQRQHAGEWPDADPHDEDQAHDQRLNRAQGIENFARDVIQHVSDHKG
jgi:hypothetical protein